MRVLIQRVFKASVTVEDKVISKIDQGLLIFVCAMSEDTESQAEALAKKISNLRIFSDSEGKMNKSIFSDAVESVIGAIYLDGGYKSSIKFIKKFWGPYLDTEVSSIFDAKTKLQEISQKKYKIGLAWR